MEIWRGEPGRRGEGLEEIRVRFIREWEQGRGPSLEAYLRRYPRFSMQLAEFAAEFYELGREPRELPVVSLAGRDDPAFRRITTLACGS